MKILDVENFRQIVTSAQLNRGRLDITVEQAGFIPFTENGIGGTKWRKVRNYTFKSKEIPVRSNIWSNNIAYCNPGVYIMQASNKRDKNKTTARIGDLVTEINQIRTQNMTRDEFDIEGNGVNL